MTPGNVTAFLLENSMAKKIIVAIIIICILPGLSGCEHSGTIYSNYREVEQLQLIRAVGVDSDGGKVRLTISSGEPVEGGQCMLLSRSAESIATAANSLQDYAAGQELYYAHTEYFLLGQRAAENGIGQYLDYIERSTTLPMGISIFLVRGGTAEGLITGSGDGQYDTGQSLASLKRVVERRGDNHVFSCADTARALSENGAALICALRPSKLDGSVFTSEVEAETTAVPDGFGILKDGALVGFVDQDEALCAVILIQNGMSALVLSDADGGHVALTLEGSKAKILPVWNPDGSLERVDVDVELRARLVELSQYHDVADKGLLDLLGGILAREMDRRFTNLLSLENQYKADFLGIGNMLRDADARRFDAMPRPWDELLGDVDFRVNVSARVDQTSDLTGSVSVDGEGEFGDSGQ